MKELLNKIQEIVSNETNEIKIKLNNIEKDVSELKTDVAELKTDVAELKTDVAELKTDVAELKTDVAVLKTDVAELKMSNNVLRSSMFTMENDYFKKIDIMYDYILFQKEINDIRFKNMSKMKKTMEYNGLKILNHETRIEVLEKNLNQSV